MARRKIIRVVGIFGLVLFASTPAFDADVPGMTCSQIASFAREVAQQKAEGVTVNKALLRLRQVLGVQHGGTEHELEKIVKAIYRMPIFSTVSPEEVGSAYQAACEHG
jgi:hypothetical protein